MVTMRNDTFRKTLINGIIATRPGPFTGDPAEAEHDGPFVLLDNVEGGNEDDAGQHHHHDDPYDQRSHL
jgi:hypothetical protein